MGAAGSKAPLPGTRPRLDEDQPRWYLALESRRMGLVPDRLLMEIADVHEKTSTSAGSVTARAIWFLTSSSSHSVEVSFT